MMWVLSKILATLVAGNGMTSSDLCPPADSINIMREYRARGDDSYNSRLVFFYSICQRDDKMIDSLQLDSFHAGVLGAGVNLVRKKITGSIVASCVQSKELRNNLDRRKDSLDILDRESLDEMNGICRKWGGENVVKWQRKQRNDSSGNHSIAK